MEMGKTPMNGLSSLSWGLKKGYPVSKAFETDAYLLSQPPPFCVSEQGD